MHFSKQLVGCLSVVLALPACVGASVQKGMNAYAAGAYMDAEAQFASIEGSIPDMNPKGYVRYCAYRGLTKMALRDPAEGCKWLRRGRDAFGRGEDAWLSGNIQKYMKYALSECGDRVEPWP